MSDILFQINPLPTWIYDIQSLRLLDVNAAAIEFFGIKKEVFIELTLSEWQPLAKHFQGLNEQSISVETYQNSRGELFNIEIRRHPTAFEGRSACLAVGQVKTHPTASIEEYQRLKLFESIITHTNDAVLVTEAEPVDLPGPRIVYVNEAFCKMTGFTAEEVIGKTPRMLQGPLSDYSALKALGKSLRSWSPYEITTINYKKNGEPFWVNFSVTPIADSKGWFTHWIAIERDVTKSIELAESLTKAKEKAEDNQRKMEEAQRLARMGSWYYDVINQVSYWSDETYRLWGLEEHLPVISFEEHEKLVHPKDWQRFKDVISHAMANGIPYKMELEVLNPDGTYKTVNTIGAPIFDDNQRVIAFEGTTQDISERVAIEKELRAARDRAERMQYIMSEASRLAKIGYVDQNFRTNVVIWSDYMYQLFGLTPDEEIHDDEQREKYYDLASFDKLSLANQMLRSHGLPYDIELKLLNAHGEELFIRKVMQPVFNEQQEVIGKRGIVQNITERKKADEEKQRFYLTLENSLNEIYMFDADTLRFTYINQGASRNVGYSLEEIKQFTPLDLKLGHTEQTFRELIAPLANKSTENVIFFTNYSRKDGSTYPVEVHLNMVDTEGVATFVAITIDITERKVSEAELLATAERLRLATSSAKMGIWDWDLVNDALRWDERMFELYGIEPENFTGAYESWQHGMHPDDQEWVNRELDEAIAGTKDFNAVFRVVWPDGSLHHIESHAIVKRDGQGKALRLIGGNIDVTQRVESEALLIRHAEDLERYNESLRSIAWTQSHVVRAPLSRILSIIDLIQLENGDLESVEALLVHLKTATEEMDEIVKKIIREANQVTNPADRLQ